MTAAPQRDYDADPWRPDEQLVPALLDPRCTVTMDSLSRADRAWAVAVMRQTYGMTAEEISERMDCTVRYVRGIWADAGVLAALYLTESANFADESRMMSGEITRLAREAADNAAARDRYKRQLDILLDAHLTDGAVPTFPCGCPRTRYNTYIAPKTGKAGCREHRRLAVARSRAKARESACTD